MILSPYLVDGSAVEVYWNLHRRMFSVRSMVTKKVEGHLTWVSLRDAKFVVSQKGRQRVIREKRKNVHATIRGTLQVGTSIPSGSFEVRYDPYENSSFVYRSTGAPIHSAEYVSLSGDRGRPKVTAKGGYPLP